jgi:hypothetical protein
VKKKDGHVDFLCVCERTASLSTPKLFGCCPSQLADVRALVNVSR